MYRCTKEGQKGVEYAIKVIKLQEMGIANLHLLKN